MSLKIFTNEISKQTNIPKVHVKAILLILEREMIKHLMHGFTLTLLGLGKFKHKTTNEIRVLHPIYRHPITIPKHESVYFKMSKTFKRKFRAKKESTKCITPFKSKK